MVLLRRVIMPVVMQKEQIEFSLVGNKIWHAGDGVACWLYVFKGSFCLDDSKMEKEGI